MRNSPPEIRANSAGIRRVEEAILEEDKAT